MTITLCHTTDWHLGRTLHGASLEPVQARFLRWLADLLVEEAADVLIVAGDVFDRSVPSSSAEQLFYGFLADLAARAPGLEVVVVAGNHDGPARLSAPAPLLGRLGVRIVGRVPTRSDGAVDADRLIVPLRARGGQIVGSILAMPFLRPSDLSLADGDDALARARSLYADAAARATAHGGLLVATGHAHVRGARLSPSTERSLFGGDAASWPLDVFPGEADYVALGHLHLAQSLAGGRVRYSGAPLPMAFSEREHPHGVVLLREGGEALRTGEERVGRLAIRAVRVPRFLELLRIEGPAGGLDPDDAAARLASLERSQLDGIGSGGSCVDASEVWVQPCVRLASPRPALKRELTEALARARWDRSPAPRLVHVDVERSVGPATEAKVGPSELSPSSVLDAVWRASSDGPLPGALAAALDEAWQVAVREAEEEGATLPEQREAS